MHKHAVCFFILLVLLLQQSVVLAASEGDAGNIWKYLSKREKEIFIAGYTESTYIMCLDIKGEKNGSLLRCLNLYSPRSKTNNRSTEELLEYYDEIYIKNNFQSFPFGLATMSLNIHGKEKSLKMIYKNEQSEHKK